MSYALLKQDEPTCHSILSANDVVHVLIHLLAMSIEFHVEPLPDDQYEIHVKQEACVTFDEIVALVTGRPKS